MGKAFGVAAQVQAKATDFANNNEYAQKAMQAGQQVAGAVGIGQGQDGQYSQASDGSTPQPGGQGMPGNFGQPTSGFGDQPAQINAPDGSFGADGAQPAPGRSARPPPTLLKASPRRVACLRMSLIRASCAAPPPCGGQILHRQSHHGPRFVVVQCCR
jgi:hypothetical protein